jgi:hypothetical protein
MTYQETYKDSPFNEHFCTHLEYHLGMTFEKSDRPELKGFWCDGVSWSPISDRQLSVKSVNDTRKIVTKAWIGKNGQDEYKMTIHFGKYALRRYAKGTEMIDCIPGAESMDWIDIDVESKNIDLRLK